LSEVVVRFDRYSGQTAAEIWELRKLIFRSERDAFLQALSERRDVARAALKFEPGAPYATR
jgi:hypothetical protein